MPHYCLMMFTFVGCTIFFCEVNCGCCKLKRGLLQCLIKNISSPWEHTHLSTITALKALADLI